MSYLSTHHPDDLQLRTMAAGLIIAADGGSAAAYAAGRKKEDIGTEDVIHQTSPTMQSTGDVINFIYSYSGAPFVAPGFDSPPVIVVSPRSLMTTKRSDLINQIFLLDSRLFAERLLAVSSDDIEHLGSIPCP